MKVIINFIALCMSLSTCYYVQAQDSHYWSHKFGPKNSMLAGSDDATGTDNAAIINNPAGIGFIDNGSLSITTNAYSLDNSKFQDGAGKGLDMRSIKPSIIPLILSAAYKHPKLPRWTAGYVLVDKSRFNFRSSQRFDASINILDDTYSPGDEEFVSQLDVQNILSEIWAGVAVGYRVNDNLSIGIGNYGAYREHSSRFQYTARAIANTSQQGLNVSSTNLLYNISYYNLRNIFKIGLSGKFGKTSTGISITMPSFTMYSQGTINGDITGQNVLIDADQHLRGSYVANDRQTQLKAKYRSPASVSVGMSHSLTTRTHVFLSAEYFLGVKPYVIINPNSTDFIRPKGITGITSRELLRVAGGAIPVLNIAIGYQTHLFKQYSLLCGARTDFSNHNNATGDLGNDLAITKASLYHGTIGVMAKRNKSDVYVGFKAGYGRQNTTQLANINMPQDNLLLTGDPQSTYYRYYTLAGMLGYVHYLK